MAAQAWTPQEWARIERLARAERAERPVVRAPFATIARRSVAYAIANGAALELRQWARAATAAGPVVVAPEIPGHLLDDAGL